MINKSAQFFGFEGLAGLSRTQRKASLKSILFDMQKTLGEKSTNTSLAFVESTLL